MVVKLVEIYDRTGTQENYGLRPIYVNPEHVSAIRPDENTSVLFESRRQALPEGLDPRQSFTRISLSDSRTSICVVGDVDVVHKKLFNAGLLKG